MDSLKSNLEAQLSELEMLRSIFCNPGELKVEDQTAIEQITEFLEGETSEIPPYVDIIVNLEIDSNKYELCVNLPHEYPQSEPEIFVRNSKMNRTSHAKLNKDLNDALSKWTGEPCVFNAISWLQDSASKYNVAVVEEQLKKEEKLKKDEKLIRYWIYSHHIYSKTKRREILSLANDLGISGFCMAGKPGVICVEGYTEDCNDWWSRIKSMNWKRIFCKVTEDAETRKFASFEEVAFTNHGMRANHMDMGEFYKYLDAHKCSYVFKDLFGVDKN